MYELRQTPVFEKWFLGLKDRQAREAISKRLVRFEVGLFGDTKSLGDGVSELRIQHGPGYRLYYAMRGKKIITLLCGGDKGSQARDIAGPENWRRRSTMKTMKFDPAEHLKSPEAQAELISEAFGTGDPKIIAHALGTVARARGMTDVARDSGVSREALYRALSEKGDPRLSTLTNVLSALGFGLEAKVLPDMRA